MNRVVNRKELIVTAAALVALSSTALAAPKATPAPTPAPSAAPTAAAAAPAEQPLQKQLAKEFPNAKVDILDTKDINGVKVHDVRVNNSTDATVTDTGDILQATIPYQASDLPPDIAAVSQNLFGVAPSHVEAFINNSYIVNVNANGKGYELKIDPTGRVTDVDTRQQAQYEDPKKQPKADNADV